MKGMTILAVVEGLLLVWALTSHAAAGGSAATDRAARLVAEERAAALVLTVTALRPTPRPCPSALMGRC